MYQWLLTQNPKSPILRPTVNESLPPHPPRFTESQADTPPERQGRGNCVLSERFFLEEPRPGHVHAQGVQWGWTAPRARNE